jgi:hypothetical protein
VITPLEFLYHFRDLLREAGIRFAITSGMACVYYGLQQNTKDSDWIIDPALREVWGNLEAADRAALARERPLLLQLDDVNDDEVLQGLIDVERRTWETINQERYRIFQQVWKDFYRRWQKEELWEWPTSEPFSRQHGRLLCAAEKHGLPHEPLDGAGKAAARERGVRRAILRTGRPEDMVRAVAPPLWRILP